jgi:hypothetical protein
MRGQGWHAIKKLREPLSFGRFWQNWTRRTNPGRSGASLWIAVQAIEAAPQMQFVPAMKDGKAVSIWIQLEYDFSL